MFFPCVLSSVKYARFAPVLEHVASSNVKTPRYVKRAKCEKQSTLSVIIGVICEILMLNVNKILTPNMKKKTCCYM